MGFLDHSTNNIIVDAVLTDLGRKALARNDGSFQIAQFALGDDEVDYDIVKQFGRTVGKEKIEKNTPIFEALTAGSLGLKYKIASVSNEFMTHFPVLNLTLTTDNSNSLMQFSRIDTATTRTKELSADITANSGIEIEVDILDAELRVEINHLFLSIPGDFPDILTADNIAIYNVNTTFGRTGSSVNAKIPIRLKSFSTTTFNTYSTSGGNYIKTYIKVTGINSGLTKQFEVQIT
jgi:hypothetical protein